MVAQVRLLSQLAIFIYFSNRLVLFYLLIQHQQPPHGPTHRSLLPALRRKALRAQHEATTLTRFPPHTRTRPSRHRRLQRSLPRRHSPSLPRPTLSTPRRCMFLPCSGPAQATRTHNGNSPANPASPALPSHRHQESLTRAMSLVRVFPTGARTPSTRGQASRAASRGTVSLRSIRRT
jgi:hypothetical protein